MLCTRETSEDALGYFLAGPCAENVIRVDYLSENI